MIDYEAAMQQVPEEVMLMRDEVKAIVDAALPRNLYEIVSHDDGDPCSMCLILDSEHLVRVGKRDSETTWDETKAIAEQAQMRAHKEAAHRRVGKKTP